MTDEEKKELFQLEKDELIELLGQYREDAEAKRKADRKAIIDKFFRGGKPAEDEGDDEEFDVFDLEKNEAFKRLKNLRR